MTAAAPAVRVRGLSKAFAGKKALDGLDLEVAPGERLAVLGASGSGKTTLLRVIAGLEEPDAGSVEVGGVVCADPEGRVPAERRGVGMVFQGLELWPHMTAAENVAFGLKGRPRGRDALSNERVRSLADAVGLDEALLARRPPTLSGGERQRVAIARALAPEPRVLLYDEPLANLDPERRAEIRRLVRDVAAGRGTTSLYVTHDAAEALEVADRLAILEAGRIVEVGGPEAVYRRPRTLAGARALGPVSLVPLRVRAGGARAVLETPFGEFDAPEGTDPRASRGALRPEQVVVAAEGAEAVVLDAFPRGPDWSFTARLAAGGTAIEGRSPSRLALGSSVRLRVLGTPVPFDWVSPASGGSA